MMAAMEGAMAFQKGLGAVHALSHPLGGLEGLVLHHGTLNAVVMPAVLLVSGWILDRGVFRPDDVRGGALRDAAL